MNDTSVAMAGQDKEERKETLGTVIDSSGLIVTALGGMEGVMRFSPVVLPAEDLAKLVAQAKDVKPTE